MENVVLFLQTYRSVIHLVLHAVIPLLIARFSENPKKVFIIMMLTMLVDVDHLLADPLYDPNRCSIGFHPLHTIYVQPIYVGMLFFKKTRWIGVGLVIHMVLDLIDCLWMKAGM